MKALQFMKIDYITVRKQSYFMPAFYGIAMLMGIIQESVMIAYAYMLFVAVVFASTPFSVSVKKNVGFLVLLPSTVKDRVAGRFLFGISYVASAVVCGALFMAVYVLLGHSVESWMAAIGLLNLAVGIFLMALEFLLMYLLGEGKFEGQNLAGIVRVLPGMAMFYFASYCIGRIDEAPAGGNLLAGIGEKLLGAGVGAMFAALAILFATAAVCVKVIEKRDYV